MSEQPDVERLREEIAQTREDLGETVQALAGKADVKARAAGAVHDAVDGAKEHVKSALDSAKSTVSGAAGAVSDTARGVVGSVAGTAHAAVDPVQDSSDNSDLADQAVVEDRPPPGLLDSPVRAALIAGALAGGIALLIVWARAARRSS